MERTRHGLLSIGAFATAAQLSLKALRLYDQLGILKPAYIDPDSGYRYYQVDQLYPARLIRLMRQMDMPLATIRSVLAASPEQAETIITDYRLSIEARVEDVRRVARELVAYLHQEEPAMNWDVDVRTVESHRVASITRQVKIDQLDDYIVGSLHTLNEHVAVHGAVADGPPFGIYHGPVNENDNGPMEVCLPIGGDVPVSGDVAVRTLDAQRVACVEVRGEQCDFPHIIKAYDAVYDWISQNGYQHDGSPWEIWLGKNGDHMQIAWPFRERS